MCLLLDCQLDYSVHRQALVAQDHALLDGLVSFLGHFLESLLGLVVEQILGNFLLEGVLQLLMLLDKEAEGVFEVLVAVLEHLVVLGEVVDEVFDEVEIVCIEGSQLDVLEVAPARLRLFVLTLDLDLAGLGSGGDADSVSTTIWLSSCFILAVALCLTIGVDMRWGSRWTVSRVLLENGAVMGAATERPR